jgi:hypothetical protein
MQGELMLVLKVRSMIANQPFIIFVLQSSQRQIALRCGSAPSDSDSDHPGRLFLAAELIPYTTMTAGVSVGSIIDPS